MFFPVSRIAKSNIYSSYHILKHGNSTWCQHFLRYLQNNFIFPSFSPGFDSFSWISLPFSSQIFFPAFSLISLFSRWVATLRRVICYDCQIHRVNEALKMLKNIFTNAVIMIFSRSDDLVQMHTLELEALEDIFYQWRTHSTSPLCVADRQPHFGWNYRL